jgi:restriction system protein
MSPIEFEYFCAELLEESGWEAHTTKASGDQGIDIIAKIDDVKAVFQCKLYSKPVGNSAVQQIIAGREFEEADFAAVITNSSFTASAFQLASVANIDLIHYEEIDEYTQMILNKKN